MFMQAGGKLILTISQAKLTRDTEVFGRMDPYVDLHYRGEEYRTKVAEDQGKHPIWNQTFELMVHSMEDEIRFTVKDSDIGKDDYIAGVFMKISQLCGSSGVPQWYSLDYKGHVAGEILMEARYAAPMQ
jgi:Ca2+-dependent lipid-binding protein